MVKDLFETAGAGQESQVFGFATDVDSGQRAAERHVRDYLSKYIDKQIVEHLDLRSVRQLGFVNAEITWLPVVLAGIGF